MAVLILLIFPISLFLFTGTSALAQKDGKIGYIAVMQGEVIAVQEDGKERTLKNRSPVYCGDTIRTGEKSRVQMIFNDNTIVSIGSASEMEIADYYWSERSGKGKMKTRVEEGAFRIMGGAITKNSPKKFKTKTPLATIGIRGSMYAGLVKDGLIQIVFEGGTGIYVTNQAGRVEINRPGEGTTVTSSSDPPETPRFFSPKEKADITQQVSFSSSRIYNHSQIRDSSNIEQGKGSRANMGTVDVRQQGSSVSGEVTNESRINDSANTAIGQDNEASVGSIIIE
ncbi:MAG: FecR domain-containing protein [Desulfobia sp.]